MTSTVFVIREPDDFWEKVSYFTLIAQYCNQWLSLTFFYVVSMSKLHWKSNEAIFLVKATASDLPVALAVIIKKKT